MVTEETNAQLSLFPEALPTREYAEGIEVKWLTFPYRCRHVDPDLAALCSQYGSARVRGRDLKGPRKVARFTVKRPDPGARSNKYCETIRIWNRGTQEYEWVTICTPLLV
jgi:hypothetical protein